MKRVLFFLCAVFVVPSLLEAGTIFDKAEGRGTSITWRTADESGVKYFVVRRRELQSGVWGPWAQVRSDVVISAKGAASSYSLEDTGIFKTAERFLEYKIEAVNEDGNVAETITYQTSYSGLTSAAKRTWGSIKAMFR
ncbi:MAG: hypothetical protein L0Y80_06940 [Ignavibacteriae bacterium]|nr:hypothetical protein [Ignavibacteriota bacterium]